MFNQAIDTANVRREELDGTEYIVAPINLLQPMYLNVPGNWDADEAYLPVQQAKESIPSWNGTPLTLNHPTSNGVATTANQPKMVEKTVLGRVFNADWEDNKATAEAWFDEKKIRDMGGMAENALERVLNGDTVEVSTGYRASQLPSGEYDGESHNAVQGNLKPDHVAVLPNNKGKCSVEAGCGVGAVAANMIVTNATMNVSEGDVVEWDSSGGMAMGVIRDTISEGEYDDEIDGDVTVSAPAALIETVEKTDDELEPTGTMVGHKTNSDTLSMVDDPPEVVDNADVADLLGDDVDGDLSENGALRRFYDSLKNVFENSDGAEPAESGATSDRGESPASDNQDTMSDKTQELVDNHGFTADNLPDEDTECFEAIYNRFTGDTEDEPTAENDDAVVFESEEAFEAKVQEIVDNREAQSEKETLAREIAGNSTEYESSEEVLEDYPTEAALNTKRKDLLGGTDFGASRGASATPATNDADADDLTMFGGDA